MRLLVLGLFLSLAAMTCGGSATPTFIPTEAAGLSDTSDIIERAEAALALASEGNWIEAWEFYTLSFRDSCPNETFAAQATSGMNLFRGMLELPPNAPLEFRLMSVTVQGDTALVNTQIFHKGDSWEYGAKDELDSWVLIDGEWWNNVPPGPEGCVN